MLTRKNAKATAVLTIIYDKVDDDQWELLSVEPYLNGRENGFALQNFSARRKAVFSENRNSDNIVIYKGDSIAFEMAGNVPCEEAYQSATYLRYDEYLQAAEHIIAYLFPEV